MAQATAFTSLPTDAPLGFVLDSITDIDLLLLEDDSLVVEGSADEDSPVSASNASSSASDTRRPKPKRRTAHCHRVKAEKEFLRRRIEELEQELVTAESTRELARQNAPPSAWRGLALRQQSKRRRAELENERLKSKLRRQLQVASGLERLFRDKTRVFFDSQAPVSSTSSSSSGTSWSGEDNTELMLQQLEKDIMGAHGIVWEVMPNGAQAGSSGVISGHESSCVTLKPASEDKAFDTLFVETRQSVLMPFPVERVRDANWTAITSAFSLQGRELEQLRNGVDEYACKFTLPEDETRQGQESETVTILIRRFVDNNCVVVIWRSFKTQSGSGPTSYVPNTGWVVLRPTDSGHTECDVCSRIEPTWTARVAPLPRIQSPSELTVTAADEKAEVGQLTDRVIRASTDDISMITDAMENMLLDETATISSVSGFVEGVLLEDDPDLFPDMLYSYAL